MSLAADDFPRFFREINGYSPFPWQERLARQVFQKGNWPKCMDLPTASGKTAVLDIAIFHLALEAARGAGRSAPVRIAFVVDRRLIVDQAHERAKRIRCKLDEGKSIAGEVAAELRKLSGDEPLVVQPLRGGLPRESDWARTPVQPTVLLSTVDQVGSRLLFRGYGVSKSMRPVHAGLLGSDCLIFVDEAHLSEPFRQSLDWVAKYRKSPAPWAAVTMSATPGESGSPRFSLETEDYEDPTLSKRLKAAKPAELRDIPATNIAASYAAGARELAARENIHRVLIVVNRVNLARAIFDELKPEDPLLLTGRVREFDRERIVDELDRRFENSEGKLFVVATQCIEAGVDRDFDALVTQVAPIDALRQRFGRLNRTGRDIEARAIICAAKEDVSKKPDPIYGANSKLTWEALEKIAVLEKKKRIVDFGVTALPADIGSSGEKLKAPIMPPAYVDLWACTNPPPSVEPEIALFLHGDQRASADVEVVWRKDLDSANLEERIPIIALLPPRAGETLSVPVWNARQWLAEANDADRVGDLEGEPDSDESPSGRPVLRWRGADDDKTTEIWPHEIRPGDILIVPSAYGGCDDWGWTGRGTSPVTDFGLEAAARIRQSRVAVRFHPGLFPDQWDRIGPLIENYWSDSDELLGLLKSEDLPSKVIEELGQIKRADALLYDEDRPSAGIVFSGRRKSKDRGTPATESDDLGSFGGLSLLSNHTAAVLNKARQFAAAAGLPERVRRALEFAAELHDAGKGDLRFQANLYDGMPGPQILAKSGRRPTKPSATPRYWRHEALSVRLAIADPRFSAQSDSMDCELALWLIGTHHGWGRPFFPHDDLLDDRERDISDADGKVIRLPAASGPQRSDFEWNDLDWPELFNHLQNKYGRWDLARMEAFLRLADHRASEEGDEQTLTAGSGAR